MTCQRSDLYWRDALHNAVARAPGGLQDAAGHISKRRRKSISAETLRKKLRGIDGESISMEMAEILTDYLQQFVVTQESATDWVCSLAGQYELMVDYVPPPPAESTAAAPASASVAAGASRMRPAVMRPKGACASTPRSA